MNIWHIGAWNRNIGDWALAYSMHRMLREQSQHPLTFHMVDSQRTYFHQGLVDQMDEEADLILIGGGGLIFHRPEDKSVSGWSFNIEPEKLEKIRKPIVVYCIGYNQFAFNPPPFPAQTADHLRLLKEKAALFSVRDTGTQRILREQYRVDSEVVPDPALCVYDRPVPFEKTKPVIAVNIANDRLAQRYAGPSDHAMWFMDRLSKALRTIRAASYQVLTIPHLEMDGRGDDDAKTLYPYLYAPAGEMLYCHVPFFTNLYRQADLTIGMRFHSGVLSIGCGTPFIPLGSHPKVHWLVEDMGLARYSIRDTTENITEVIMAALQDKALKAETERARDQAILKIRAFNERVLAIL